MPKTNVQFICEAHEADLLRRSAEILLLYFRVQVDEKPDHGCYQNYTHGCPDDPE